MPAVSVLQRIEQLCDFIENPAVQKAMNEATPVTMPPGPGAHGFDEPLWVGLGLVGIWAALDAYADRAEFAKKVCSTCKSRCIHVRYQPHVQGPEDSMLAELEDLRHLYAHNYAGEADGAYFAHGSRHVLRSGVPMWLTSGGRFDGHRAQLNLGDLRTCARVMRGLLERLHRIRP